MKICLVFNGQGAFDLKQVEEFLRTQDDLSDAISMTNEIMDEDMMEILHNPKLLQQAKYAQIATFFMNHCSYLAAKKKMEIEPYAVIGHSLGHYNALVVAGCLSYQDALRIVKKRSELAEGIANQCSECGMVRIVGQDIDIYVIEQLCEKMTNGNKVVEVSIINSPQNIILSYSNYYFDEIEDVFCDYQIKKIAVPVPYHSSAMIDIVPDLLDTIHSVTFSEPKMIVLSNVLGKPINKRQMKLDLVQHLCTKIDIYKCIKYLSDSEVDQMIEIGISKVMSKIASFNEMFQVTNILLDQNEMECKGSEEKINFYEESLEMLGQLMSMPNINGYEDILRYYYDRLMKGQGKSKEVKEDFEALNSSYEEIMGMNEDYVGFYNQRICLS